MDLIALAIFVDLAVLATLETLTFSLVLSLVFFERRFLSGEGFGILAVESVEAFWVGAVGVELELADWGGSAG